LAALELRADVYEREPTTLRAEITVFDRAARLRRGALPYLPVALLCLPVILMPPHFPGLGLVIFVLVLGLRRFRQESQFDRVAGPCPACRAQIEPAVPPSAALPVTVACPGCGEFLKLSEVR